MKAPENFFVIKGRISLCKTSVCFWGSKYKKEDMIKVYYQSKNNLANVLLEESTLQLKFFSSLLRYTVWVAKFRTFKSK